MINIKSYIKRYGTRIWFYDPKRMCEVILYSNPWLMTSLKYFIRSKQDYYNNETEQISNIINIDIIVSRTFKLYAWFYITNWKKIIHKEPDYKLLPLLLFLGKVKPVDNFRILTSELWNKDLYDRKSILLYRHKFNIESELFISPTKVEQYSEYVQLYKENSICRSGISVVDTNLIFRLNLTPYENKIPLNLSNKILLDL